MWGRNLQIVLPEWLFSIDPSKRFCMTFLVIAEHRDLTKEKNIPKDKLIRSLNSLQSAIKQILYSKSKIVFYSVNKSVLLSTMKMRKRTPCTLFEIHCPYLILYSFCYSVSNVLLHHLPRLRKSQSTCLSFKTTIHPKGTQWEYTMLIRLTALYPKSALSTALLLHSQCLFLQPLLKRICT